MEAIQSVAYQNIEIIVVEAGSDGDKNEKICSRISNCKYIKIPNSGGPAMPRNIGMRESKGKYIAFLDDDDLFISEKTQL